MKVIWNDQIVDRTEVKIDLEDRGYQFADGIYDVVRAYNGKFFTLDEHIDRFFSGMSKIDLEAPFTKAELKERLAELLKVNKIETGNVYFQITRGIASPRDHVFPEPTIVSPVFTASTTVVPRNVEKMTKGITAGIVPDTRWLHCDIKSISLLGNIMAKHTAHKNGFDEAILHRDGIVTECSSSNMWMVKDGTIYTHPDGNLILPGITKIVLLRAAAKAGIPVLEKEFTLEQLKEADEAFSSSTTIEAMPIIEIDGTAVGNGKKGPIVETLQQYYIKEIEAQCGSIMENSLT